MKDIDVAYRVLEHWSDARQHFNNNNIVVCALQGSQNYGLDYEGSDVDTKLIVTPSLEDICRARPMVSTTFIRNNDEHIDFKDIRLYTECFRKQNLNFLEILFTNYCFTNPSYEDSWKKLVSNREEIARMNPYRAVKSMCGVAKEKYHAMEHPYPSKLELIQEKGFDGKQVSHLLRIEDYMRRYIAGESYEDCLRPTPIIVDRLMAYKRQEIPLDIARVEAAAAIARVDAMAKEFCEGKADQEDPEMRELLDDVCTEIMIKSIKLELE